MFPKDDKQPPEPPQIKEEEPEPSQIKEEEPEPSQSQVLLLVLPVFTGSTGSTVGGQSSAIDNVDSPNSVRELMEQRLTAAAAEIYTEFQQTVIQYQDKIQTQQRLLKTTWTPQIQLHRIGMDTPSIDGVLMKTWWSWQADLWIVGGNWSIMCSLGGLFFFYY